MANYYWSIGGRDSSIVDKKGDFQVLGFAGVEHLKEAVDADDSRARRSRGGHQGRRRVRRRAAADAEQRRRLNETEADAVERRQAEADAEKRWRDALRERETEADAVARRRAEADGESAPPQ